MVTYLTISTHALLSRFQLILQQTLQKYKNLRGTKFVDMMVSDEGYEKLYQEIHSLNKSIIFRKFILE